MQGIGQLKHVTVWLVLLGFLCGVMGPSVSFAKVYRDIDTEGDPGDGDGKEGAAGSGIYTDGVLDQSPLFNDIGQDLNEFAVVLVPRFVKGKLVFRVEYVSMEFYK